MVMFEIVNAPLLYSTLPSVIPELVFSSPEPLSLKSVICKVASDSTTNLLTSSYLAQLITQPFKSMVNEPVTII